VNNNDFNDAILQKRRKGFGIGVLLTKK